jgi:hypothetical protein
MGMTLSTLEFWKFWSDVGVVVFTILAAGFGVFALYFGMRVSELKDVDANRVKLDIATANERAATANATAERERVARLELEARLADRVINDDEETQLKAAFEKIKGQTADLSVFGDNADIANVVNRVFRCLKSAGVHVNTFTPLGGPVDVRGVLVGTSSDALPAVKEAADSMVAILRETLQNGIGMWDFSKLDVGQTAGMSSETDAGAEPRGKAPLRIWIGAK